MHVFIGAEQTLFLDKLIGTTDSELITFEWDFSLSIHLTSPDLSHMTIIKLDETFFQEFSSNGFNGTASIARTKFFQPGMKCLKLSVSDRAVLLEYQYEGVKHSKSLFLITADMYDLDFKPRKTFSLDLVGLNRVLERTSLSDKVQIKIGNTFVIEGKMIKLEVGGNPSEDEFFQFVIETAKFNKILNISNNFNECFFGFSEEVSPLNVVFKRDDMNFSTFISVE